MPDDYAARGFGGKNVGFGERPGVVVVDFQLAFTDKRFPLGGAPLVERAVVNTATLLKAARAARAPVAACFTAYKDERDAPHWKIPPVLQEFRLDHPGSALDPRIYDAGYDLVVRKTGPSIFFNTPVVNYLIKQRVDTVIVAGCNTSGCIRGSVIDAFSYGFRTIVPEPCVGDVEEGPHRDNLRDVGRRYADVTGLDEVLAYLDGVRKRNS